MSYMFCKCYKLESVSGLDMQSATSEPTSMFQGCAALVSCFIKNLKVSVSFKDSPILSKESVLYLFENAQTITSAKTITLHADVFAQLTDDEIAIATEKGFSVVSA